MTEEIAVNDLKTERVLVCLSPSPSNESVILVASKMARAFSAELTALFVETPALANMRGEDQERLKKNGKLAEENGASLSYSYGDDVALQIAQFARACGATKIVIGRPNHKRTRILPKSDIPQRLMQLVPELEVYIIPHVASVYTGKKIKKQVTVSGVSLLITLGVLCGATLIGLLLQHLGFTDANIITIYILSVLLSSFLTESNVCGIFASVLSVLVFNFFFTEPRFSLSAYDPGYPITFLVMFIASLLTSSLTARAKEESKLNAQKAYRTEVLLTASRNLQQAESADEIMSETATQLLKLMGRPVLLYPASDGKLQKPLLLSPQGFNESEIRRSAALARERETANRVFASSTQSGATTKTDVDARFWYLAVRGNSVHAVAGIDMERGERIGEFERGLLLALLGECGVAMEKQRLRENQTKLAMAAQQEKLRADFLRSISHDLRTPLTSISGNAEMLMTNRIPLNEEQKHRLYTDIFEDSEWLISLVENLLSITRMDDRSLVLNLKPELIFEVIDEAVSHAARRARNHNLKTAEGDELLMAKVDAQLIVQVLVNLIDNAVKYTPPGSDIVISARGEGNRVLVSVADSGPGVAPETKSKLFEMFYTAGGTRGDARRGLGLGLALCRTIIKAHGGEIWVSDNVPRGAVFTFSLVREEALSDAQTAGLGG